MTPEQLQTQINVLSEKLYEMERKFRDHEHTGIDTKLVVATPVLPNQGSLTAKDAAVVDVTYGAQEMGVIGNNRTRIEQIETALIAIGVLT